MKEEDKKTQEGEASRGRQREDRTVSEEREGEKESARMTCKKLRTFDVKITM